MTPYNGCPQITRFRFRILYQFEFDFCRSAPHLGQDILRLLGIAHSFVPAFR